LIQLGEHFRDSNRSRHSEWLLRQRRQWFIKARRNHAQKEDSTDKQAEEILSLATETMMATQVQINAFEKQLDVYESRLDDYEARLDAYDAAIANAITENNKMIDIINQRLVDTEARLQHMLERAYVMEDGRRVFKSKDGSYAIDEHGKNVSRDEVNFDDVIGLPAEQYMKDYTSKQNDIDERAKRQEFSQTLFKAQAESDVGREKLGQARELIAEKRARIEKGGITGSELEKMKSDLKDVTSSLDFPTIPISTINNIAKPMNTAEIPSAKTAFSANADSSKAVTSPVISASKFEPGG